MSNKEYNLFIKPTKIDDIIANKDDKSTAYIILQNNTLHTKYQEITQKNTELTSENDELESLNDSLERSKSCLQGVAKNQYLLSQEKTKQVEYYKYQVHNCYDQNKLINILTIPYVLLILFHITNFKVLLTIMIIISSSQINQYIENTKWMKQLTNNENIVKIEEEIKLLDKSNDHLHDLIDSY